MRNLAALITAIVFVVAVGKDSNSQTTSPNVLLGNITVYNNTPSQVTTYGVHYNVNFQVVYTVDSNNPSYNILSVIVNPGLPGKVTGPGSPRINEYTYTQAGVTSVYVGNNMYDAIPQVQLPLGLEGYYNAQFYLVNSSAQALPGFIYSCYFYVDKNGTVTKGPIPTPVNNTPPRAAISISTYRDFGSYELISGLYTIPNATSPNNLPYSGVEIVSSSTQYGPAYYDQITTGDYAVDQDIPNSGINRSYAAFVRVAPPQVFQGGTVTYSYFQFFNVDAFGARYTTLPINVYTVHASRGPAIQETLDYSYGYPTPSLAAFRPHYTGSSQSDIPPVPSNNNPVTAPMPRKGDLTNRIKPSQRKFRNP